MLHNCRQKTPTFLLRTQQTVHHELRVCLMFYVGLLSSVQGDYNGSIWNKTLQFLTLKQCPVGLSDVGLASFVVMQYPVEYFEKLVLQEGVLSSNG